MDSINLNKSILVEREAEDSEKSNVTSLTSSEMIKTEASLIEKELITSLKLIESGLTNLDIEAAHLLNPPGWKMSYAPASNYSSNKINLSERISAKKKTDPSYSINSNFGLPANPKVNGRIDIQCSSKSSTSTSISYSTSKLDEVVHVQSKILLKKDQQSSKPPDLTFSFYTSKETIIPSTPLESSDSPATEPFVVPLNNIIFSPRSSCTTVKEIVSSSPEASPFSVSGLELKSRDFDSEFRIQEQLFPESNLEFESGPSKSLSVKMQSDDSVVEMHDITESLLKIKSALDNLDREAAYLLNPVGLKLFYSEPSTEAPSSLENNELYPLKDN